MMNLSRQSIPIFPTLLLSLLAGGVAAQVPCVEPQWDNAIGQPGMDGAVRALTAFDDGSGGGPNLYAGGDFSTAGGLLTNNIARWDGSTWSALGSGTGGDFPWIRALSLFDDGSGGGPELHAGGGFTAAGGVDANRIAKWNGTAWSALGSGMDSYVSALTVFDDGLGGGAQLYAGGIFTTAGGLTANYIAKWDGTAWSALGSAISGTVSALAVFDDGSGGGPALYAGGAFTFAGGVQVNRIARWNGTHWSALGSGMNAPLTALLVFDDGSGGGPALYAGGAFTTAGGLSANRIAKWNGTAWSALGSALNSTVSALAEFDDGTGGGPALHVGGSFTMAGGVSANCIAKWNGTSWSALGSGVEIAGTPIVHALTAYDDGSGGGPALHVGGYFNAAGGLSVNYIAQWTGSCIRSFCFGDGSGTACPCGNAGAPGRGCANGTFSAGGQLSGSGVPSVANDTLVLLASGSTPGQPGLYFQGDNATAGGDGAVFGDGLRCAGGSVLRLELQIADGNGDAMTSLSLSTAGGITGGELKRYQWWYRDPSLSPCGDGFNLSNGLEVSWAP